MSHDIAQVSCTRRNKEYSIRPTEQHPMSIEFIHVWESVRYFHMAL